MMRREHAHMNNSHARALLFSLSFFLSSHSLAPVTPTFLLLLEKCGRQHQCSDYVMILFLFSLLGFHARLLEVLCVCVCVNC